MPAPTARLPASAFDPEGLRAVVATEATPTYVYDVASIQHRVREVRNAFSAPDFMLLFATMANSNERILRILAAEGVGACVNSLAHLQASLSAGIPPRQIQFTSTGLPEDEMRQLSELGVTVNLDSALQAKIWCDLQLTGPIGLRVNAFGLDPAGSCGPDRIGIDPEEVSSVVDACHARGVRICGLHAYTGTNNQQCAPMIRIIERLCQLAANVPELAYVNIGGGMGVDYSRTGRPFDVAELGRQASRCIEQLSDRIGRGVALVFEPGRSLLADSGVLLTRITDLKTVRGHRYLVVDASVAIFPRPLIHPDTRHRISPLDGDRGADLVPCTVVGRTTYTRDILGEATLPHDLQLGDVLVLADAGAYCESMTSRFLGQREARVHLIDG